MGSDFDKSGKNKNLKDVEFTLQEVINGTPQNQYIDAKGLKHSKSQDATLKTNSDGQINVVGLDEGTYILKEVTPAPGYNNSPSNGVTFNIARGAIKQDGSDVTPDKQLANIKADKDVVKTDSAAVSTGKLSFTIVDQKGTGLPLTGLNGVTFTCGHFSRPSTFLLCHSLFVADSALESAPFFGITQPASVVRCGHVRHRVS